jgi:phage tail sheath gpL-like
MPQTPKLMLDDINAVTSAWVTLAPTASFGGMTLAQYKNKVKPSLDARDTVDTLNNQLTSAMDARDNADVVSAEANQKVVKGVVGDANFGDDSDLYDAMGYVRKSERKSGLKRGNPAKPVTPAGK